MAGSDLANSRARAHIAVMATHAPTTKAPSRYAGRSALTGRLVLKPASKGGSVTLAQVRKAVRQVSKKH